MLDSHAQDRELVQLAGHGVTGGHQGRELVDEAVHLVPPTLLNLAVSLPVGRARGTDYPSRLKSPLQDTLLSPSYQTQESTGTSLRRVLLNDGATLPFVLLIGTTRSP